MNNNSKDIDEIERLDALLTLKTAEKEEARLSRIQLEKESEIVLLDLLQCTGIPRALKKNIAAYLKLINEMQHSGLVRSENSENGTGKFLEDVNNANTKNLSKQELKPKNFITKNIQLAKCGMGSLSTTDEEKDRIGYLMSEGDNCPDKRWLDAETSAHLDRIDVQLEAKRNEKCQISYGKT